MVDEKTKIWAAGFFDGEGGISLHVANGVVDLYATVSNTVKESVELFHELWGGSFHLSVKASKGKHNRDCWQVIFRWDDAYRIICDLLPYVRVKKRQFELAKEYFEKVDDLKRLRRKRMTGVERQYRKEVQKTMKRLNDGEDLQGISMPTFNDAKIQRLF